MNFEQRVSEPKPSKCGTMMVRTVKIGNKLLGTVEMPKGSSGATFWATSEVVRVSDAGRHLAVSRARIAGIGMYGVGRVGLRCTDGTTYVTTLDAIRAALALAATERMTGAYISLPISSWEVELPPEDVRVHNTLEKMRVGRRKSSLT